MKKLWEYSKAYDLLRRYVNCCSRLSYCRFEVTGAENLPENGAVMIASNHCNALMDALAICAAARRPVSFGTRADLFQKPRTAAILRWMLMVPLARHERDSVESVAHNREIFEEVAESMKHVPFALFVEGTHRAKRSLLPLRKGVFWMADHALNHDAGEVTIVPTGLEYGEYFDYMTTLRVTFGKPIVYKGGEDKEALSAELRNRIASMITYFPDDENYDAAADAWEKARKKPRSWWKYPLALLLLPVFATCGAVCSPVIIASEIMVARLKDKAWSNTVRFCFRLPFFFIWPFHSAFYGILRFYKSLI